MDETRRKALIGRLEVAQHGMQAGVQMLMNNPRDQATTPKHLRVGVNSALIDHSALIGLLVKKGIITDDEYLVAMVEGMEAEHARYEAEVSRMMGGAKVKLV